jgi:hypothetical protein
MLAAMFVKKKTTSVIRVLNTRTVACHVAMCPLIIYTHAFPKNKSYEKLPHL